MKKCVSCNHIFEAKDWRCPKCAKEPDKKNDFLWLAPAIDVDDLHYPQVVYDKLFSISESDSESDFSKKIQI